MTQAESFMPSMVVNYARERHGLKLDPRRVHDAIKKLVKRNTLLKRSRRWYMLNSEISISEEDLKRIAQKVKNELRDIEVDGLNQGRNGKEDEGASMSGCEIQQRVYMYHLVIPWIYYSCTICV